MNATEQLRSDAKRKIAGLAPSRLEGLSPLLQSPTGLDLKLSLNPSDENGPQFNSDKQPNSLKRI